MLVGDSSYLKQKVYEKIKVAGIAHVIAISGMHMVVVVSIIFFVFRWLCSLSNYISLRFDAKKSGSYHINNREPILPYISWQSSFCPKSLYYVIISFACHCIKSQKPSNA